MGQRPLLFCIIPPERADALLGRLREHFADDPHVAVIVERRAPDRQILPPVTSPSRDRRAPVVARDILLALPRELQAEAHHVRFVQRLEPVRRIHEDTDIEELLVQTRARDADAVSELWWRFSERVCLRLRARLGVAARDAAGLEVLGRILDELDADDPKPERLGAWLDRVADRYVDDRITRRQPSSAAPRPSSGTRNLPSSR